MIGNEDSGAVKPPQKGEFYTEEDWNTTSTAEKGAYFVSKVRFRGIASTSTQRLKRMGWT